MHKSNGRYENITKKMATPMEVKLIFRNKI